MAAAVSLSDTSFRDVLLPPLEVGEDGIRLVVDAPTAIAAVAFNNELRSIAGIDRRGNLRVFDLNREKHFRAARVGLAATHALYRRGDSNQIVLALSDTTLRVYDVNSGNMVESLAFHKDAVHSMAQNKDGTIFVTASADGAALWNTADWRKLRSLGPTETSGDITASTYLEDADYIVMAFGDDSVMVWNAANFGRVAKLLLPEVETGAKIDSLAGSADGTLLAAGNILAVIFLCAYSWMSSYIMSCLLQAV
jgi:WD40 repeat protein